MAKKYHPDKNKSADAIDQFRNVHEAYTYLLKRIHHDDFYNTGEEEDDEDNVFYTEEGYRDDDQVYMDFLKPYTEQLWILKYLFQNKSQRQVIMAIVRKIFSYSIDACIEYLKNVDRGILQIIYDVFSRFKSSLEIEETLLEKIAEILKSKTCANATDNDDDKQNEKIIVHPFLCDLFEEKVYRLKISPTVDTEVLVPLWHHELVYDVSAGEVVVECFPILPDNITIDEKNNVHMALTFNINDIWNQEQIEVEIGGRKFYICRKELYMTDFQCKVFHGKGIPVINGDNMYDVSKKSDVIFYIKLCLLPYDANDPLLDAN